MTGKQVMVLDDEALVGERLMPVLEKEGLEVEVFTESQKALDRLKEKSFHVVVTDLKMKGADGLDVLNFVKTHSPGTQVILITAYGSFEQAREAEAIGVFEFVSKPFKMSALCKLVVKAAKKAALA
ncbi:MAG: response regulator [Elusimicrobiota bacterium]